MSNLSIDVALSRGRLDMHIELEAIVGTTVVVGPNGAGKTTLLKTLLGDVSPERGSIRLGDQCLYSSEQKVDMPLPFRRLGYVPQRYALFPHLSVAQNVAFGLRGVERSERERRVRSLLDDFSVAHLSARKPAGLSGGEAQRVALARALAIEPQALLLDEPMGALDATIRRKVRDVLRERLRALELPTLIVTHDMEDVAQLADRVAVIEEGVIVQVGTVDELKGSPKSDFVREFFGSGPQIED